MTPIIMHAGRMVRKGARFVTLAAAITLLPDAGAFAAQPPDQMRIRKSISAPAGAADLCGRYSWACARSGRLNMSDANAMSVAKAVNSKINRAVRPVSDRTQYGTEEYWTLPSARGGDCEDVVLAKKKALMAAGVSPDRLLIATVLDRNRGSHAVLVVRTASADYVLDSLTSSIKPWRATGYSFLKMQDPERPSRWNAIFSGGIFATRG